MAPSDQLARLAVRAKEAEERVAAAQAKAKAELEDEVETARASAQAQAEKLHQKTGAEKEQIPSTWQGAQQAWNQHIAAAHERSAAKKAEMDAAKAERAAHDAESEALFAIEWAYAAVEEAECATLQAGLARMDADQPRGPLPRSTLSRPVTHHGGVHPPSWGGFQSQTKRRGCEARESSLLDALSGPRADGVQAASAPRLATRSAARADLRRASPHGVVSPLRSGDFQRDARAGSPPPRSSVVVGDSRCRSTHLRSSSTPHTMNG
jgi:hypothetical protein